jgi:ABC-type glycerol-3-phosphate transport system substrate-binding protein
MKNSRALVAALVVMSALTASCGSETTATTTTTTTVATTTTTATATTTAPAPAPVITISDLVGSWTATSHVYTGPGGDEFDLIANGGETRVTVLDNGGARTWVTIGEISDEWDAQLSLSGGQLISTPVEAERGTNEWDFTLEDDTLTMTRADSSFDFTLSGAEPTEAIETLVFVRN